VTDVLIYGDTIRFPELRHELPIAVPDPFLYVEAGGRKHAVISSMEIPRLEEAGGIECHPHEEFGLDELIASGLKREEIYDEISVRAVQALGVTSAVVPYFFPLAVADRLRAEGVELSVDQELFQQRRRVKSAAELEGIRRAQRAAEAGMGAARDLLRRAEASDGIATLDGEPLTSERLKAAISAAFTEHGCTADEFVVSHGAQAAVGHHMGSGPIRVGEPVVIDLWPRDNESACYAVMTRTFCVGEPSEELREWHRHVKEALDRTRALLRPGIAGRAVYDASCDVFEQAGYPTQRTKTPGEPLMDGYFHSLGHGVGLEVHEEPGLGMTGQDELVAGDVVTLEPGLYRQGAGGCRLEDLLLVTDGGAETLTDFPYDLEP
jgi:Xaa-Pro aminopeptidase